jgi:hypothetical protein
MKRTVQTRLTEFDESAEKETTSCPAPTRRPSRPRGQLWDKVTNDDEDWGVAQIEDTVLFVKLVDGRLHAQGMEIVCKWCGGVLEIREDKVFCAGRCERYQGKFSWDFNAYLQWEGAKSYTLRKQVAKAEKLVLEPRDLAPIAYAPNWSVLEEYEEDVE